MDEVIRGSPFNGSITPQRRGEHITVIPFVNGAATRATSPVDGLGEAAGCGRIRSGHDQDELVRVDVGIARLWELWRSTWSVDEQTGEFPPARPAWVRPA
ncbi:MAG: hypothetical protein ACRDQ0_02145 [Pseudonocardia sp.]